MEQFALFRDQTILVTGHTGFKGSWLATWLLQLGAKVVGFSLEQLPTTPSNFELCNLSEQIIDLRGDIRDRNKLRIVIKEYRPNLIFHLAAQPIVLHGYQHPAETFDANVMGTINLLEAVRQVGGVSAVVCATTDKVYANQEWLWGYRETDRLGGSDPYSASKAMAELAIESYRASYFSAESGTAIASVRAGNVIGGGDFADHRLVPDCIRALMENRPILLRNPHSVRPWVHVLEPLYGYLLVAERLLRMGQRYASAWNFGPLESNGVTAQQIAEQLIASWGDGRWESPSLTAQPKETNHLRLSWEKASAELGWRPAYDWQTALAEVVAWFKAYEAGEPMLEVTQQQIARYMARRTHQENR